MHTDVTMLGSSRNDAIWTYALLGSGGALVLGLAPLLSSWLAGFPFVPFRDVLEWIGGFDDGWTWVARPLAGLLLGLAGAWIVLREEYRLEVGADELVVVHGEDRRRIPRDAVVGVHRDGKTVVVDGHEGRRLFEQKVEAGSGAVRTAFVARGYPYESD